MNKIKAKLLKKSNLWHVGAIGLFLLISVIYFYPNAQGYSVNQQDVQKWIGMSQEIKDYREFQGQVGWTNSMFSGMPATQISMGYGGRQIPVFLREAYYMWMPRPISSIFIYFLSFYIMALSFRVKPYIAIIGALAFGFSSSHIIIIEAGHLTKALAIGFLPLVIAGFIYAYRWKNWILGAGLSALFMSFELQSNHLQITYYMAFILVGLGIVELYRASTPSKNIPLSVVGTLLILLSLVLSVFISNTGLRISLFTLPAGIGLALLIKNSLQKKKLIKFGKITLAVILAYGIALMINIGNLAGTSEYGKYTTRGGTDLTINASGESTDEITTSGLDKEYITAWSYGKGETFTFLVPNFKGGETMRISDNEANDGTIEGIDKRVRNDVKSQNQYWGEQPFTSGPVYLGIIVVFLALLGLVYSNDRSKWALLIVTIITVMLSWGKNFMGFTDLFLDYLPGYNKFRAVTIILAVAQLCVPLLGVLFLHKLEKSKDEIVANLKGFFIVSGILGGLLLLFLAVPTLFNSFITDSETAQLDNLLATPNIPAENVDYFTSIFDELETARISIFRNDVLRSIAFLALAFGAVFAFIKGKFSKYALAGTLGILILFDLGMVAKRYMGTESQGKGYAQWTESWKQLYPYQAGNGDLEIYNLEAQSNPEILLAVDTEIRKVQSTYTKDMQGGEKKRIEDRTKFRVLNRMTNYRVFDLANPFNSSYASYFHKSIGGYHGAKLGRYQELIEFHIGGQNPSVLDMLNMKYQIAAQFDQKGSVINSQFVAINSTAMGNAWFTKDVKSVANANEEILALGAKKGYELTPGPVFPVILNGELLTETTLIGNSDVVKFVNTVQTDSVLVLDTMDIAIPFQSIFEEELAFIPDPQQGTLTWAYNSMLDSSFMKIIVIKQGDRKGWDPNKETVVGADFIGNVSQQSYSGEGTIEMTSYGPDELLYTSTTTEKQLAVFSEIYYPAGWKAYIDGEEVPISRANFALRAIEIPAGTHEIKFAYVLESYNTLGTVAWTGSILMVLFIGLGLFMSSKLETETKEEELTEEA